VHTFPRPFAGEQLFTDEIDGHEFFEAKNRWCTEAWRILGGDAGVAELRRAIFDRLNEKYPVKLVKGPDDFEPWLYVPADRSPHVYAVRLKWNASLWQKALIRQQYLRLMALNRSDEAASIMEEFLKVRPAEDAERAAIGALDALRSLEGVAARPASNALFRILPEIRREETEEWRTIFNLTDLP